MKKFTALLFMLLMIVSFNACDDDSGGGGGSSGWNYENENPPAYATLASADFHFNLPDQYNYEDGGGTAANEVADLFNPYAILYSITLVLTNSILYDDTPTYVSGYALDLFVDEDTVNTASGTPLLSDDTTPADCRAMYSIVVRSNDAEPFDNRTKFSYAGSDEPAYYTDLTWDEFSQGYLLDLNYDGRTFFEESLGLRRMYNIKWAYDIYMFRKIDVKRVDESIATFEIAATTTSYIDDTDYTHYTDLSTTKFNVTEIDFHSNSLDVLDTPAISLEQFITDYVTNKPSSHTYDIVAVDDFSRTGWTWDQIKYDDGTDTDEIAYYLVDYDFICRAKWSTTNSRYEQVSQTKIDFPVRIEVIE